MLTVAFTDCDGVESRQAFQDVKLAGAGQVSCHTNLVVNHHRSVCDITRLWGHALYG